MSPADLALAALLGVPAAACAWSVARAVEDRISPHAGVWLWRAARAAAFAPLLAMAVLHLPSSPFAPVQASAGAGSGAAPAAAPAFQPVIEPALIWLDAARQAAPSGLVWLIVALYGAGLAVMIARAVNRRRAVSALMRNSRPAGAHLEAVAARWRDRLGLAPETAPVRIVDAHVSPFVTGLHARILAPAGLGTGAGAELAIAHELTHVRRGDERDRLIGEILAGLVWFNPAMAAIERRLSGARELACDADVLAFAAPGVRRRYAEAIAELAPSSEAGATAFLTDLPDLRRRRVAAALGQGPRKAGRLAAALAGALVVAAALPASGLASMLAGQTAERVRQTSPQTLSDPVGAIVLEAQTLVDDGAYAEAITRLDAAPVETAYEVSVVERLRAAALFQSNDIAGAAESFEAALNTGALVPDEEQAVRMNLMQLYAVLSRYDDAVAMIAQLEERGFEPTSAQAKLFAQVYVQAGDPAAALRYAETFFAGTEAPSRSELLLMQVVYEQAGRTQEAEAMAARAAELAQD